jgi:hypothetical protein
MTAAIVRLVECDQSHVATPLHDAGDLVACPLCGRLCRISDDWRWPRHQRAAPSPDHHRLA